MQEQEVVGRTIVEVRPMTDAELQEEGWEDWNEVPAALVLDDGTVLYPSRDTEGNGPGALFGIKGEQGFLLFGAP